MHAWRGVLVLVLGSAACAAAAQSYGAMRWAGAGDGYYGLNAGRSDFRVPCGSIAFPCSASVGLMGLGDELRVVGRYSPVGPSYGVGLRWDFSPRMSAMVGWDNYDTRFMGASSERDVRATSLGLQLRY
jgi:hypothetical protein